MKHSLKIKLARKMRTAAEVRMKTPLFLTKLWSQRFNARRKKELTRYHGK